MGKPAEVGADANRRLNLAEVGKAQGRKYSRDSEPDLGKPAVRDYRGASGNVAHGGNVNPSRNRKSENGKPPPTAGAPKLYPNQGERRSIQHVPDTERRSRVTGVGGRAESSKGEQGDEVHRLAPPPDGRSATGKLLLTEEESRTGSRRSVSVRASTGLTNVSFANY